MIFSFFGPSCLYFCLSKISGITSPQWGARGCLDCLYIGLPRRYFGFQKVDIHPKDYSWSCFLLFPFLCVFFEASSRALIFFNPASYYCSQHLEGVFRKTTKK